MANLNSRDLLYALLDACRRYTDAILFVNELILTQLSSTKTR